jgi:large repetitive protein
MVETQTGRVWWTAAVGLLLAACSGSSMTGQAGDNVLLQASPNPSNYPLAVVFTATVSSLSGTPTGTVTFEDNGVAMAPGVQLSSGTATYSNSQLSVRTHLITAVYSGDANFVANTSPATSQIVNAGITTIALVLNQLGAGQPVTFDATVTSTGGGVPTGAVTFFAGTQAVGTTQLAAPQDGESSASLSTSSLSTGTQSFTATYAGDANYMASTSPPVERTIQ